MDNDYFDKPIAYLEDQDFDKKGNLVVNIPSNMPVVVMLQSSWCTHCKTAKPEFQSFANATKGRVFCATVQVDGERESEKALGERIKIIKPNFRGFPDYLLYNNGIRIDKEIKGRDVRHLRDFSQI
jgi:thiol-disulfide isomerase/thioredoxin